MRDSIKVHIISSLATFVIFFVLGIFAMASVTAISQAKPVKKDYQKGYNKGYADAVAVYAQENARRDSLSDLRHNQFIIQLQRLTIAINNYNKATRHIQGINYER